MFLKDFFRHLSPDELRNQEEHGAEGGRGEHAKDPDDGAEVEAVHVGAHVPPTPLVAVSSCASLGGALAGTIGKVVDVPPRQTFLESTQRGIEKLAIPYILQYISSRPL